MWNSRGDRPVFGRRNDPTCSVAGGTARVRDRARVLVVCGLALALSALGPMAQSLPGGTDLDSGVLFSVPLGEETLEYGGGGADEFAWGPVGIAETKDGTIWLADGVRSRLLGFTPAGALVAEIDVGTLVVGIGDLDASSEGLVVLDIAAQDPKVVLVDPSNPTQSEFRLLPKAAGLENGLSGLYVGPGDRIFAELHGGATLVPIAGSGVAYEAFGNELVLEPAVDAEDTATVWLGEVKAELPVDGRPGSVAFVGAVGDSAFVVADGVGQSRSGALVVDSVVNAIESEGTVTAKARVPLADMVAYVPHPVALRGDGSVVVLVTLRDRIDVRLAEFSESLPSVIPTGSEGFLAPSMDFAQGVGGVGLLSGCVSRNTMASTDSGYRSNSHYYNSTNIDGSCTNRLTPRHLSSAGTYYSVPYKWNGFHTVAQFNAQMSPATGRAGDIETDHTTSCSYGVDCSGFVSRVWQTTTKYGTSTLPNISYSIPVGWLEEYDVFNKPGSHVVLYLSTQGSGYTISHATTYQSQDRVVSQWVSSSYVNGFTPRRFDDVCGGP